MAKTKTKPSPKTGRIDSSKPNKSAEPKSASDSFRPLVGEGNKFKPLRQIYNGFEIEKRWVVMTVDDDHSKAKNGKQLYNKALENGDSYEQGYIMDQAQAVEMVAELGIVPDFQPNTVRLRKINGKKFIFTLKDKKETKRREVEWELDRKTFNKYWPLTIDHRVTKRRFITNVKGKEVMFDAFTDRFLLMVEIEVKDEKELETLPKMGFDVTNDSSWTNKKLAK
jgi:CYTH domain-containing protein